MAIKVCIFLKEITQGILLFIVTDCCNNQEFLRNSQDFDLLPRETRTEYRSCGTPFQ